MRNKNPYILGIIISAPFILWAILLILPTFDDWTTLSMPNYALDYQTYIFPLGMTWRPFDAIMGYVNAIDYHLYPTLNHVLIFMAHMGSTFVIYKLTEVLEFNKTSRNIATLFFYISPCTMGTILSCDALNQSYSHLWGILSVFLYLTINGKKKYIAWVVCTYMSVLSKDNGLAWAIVPPIMALTFDKIDKKTCRKELVFGFAIALSYCIVRFSLPYTYIKNGSYEEDVVSIHSRIKGLVNWISYTWFAADYIDNSYMYSDAIIAWYFKTFMDENKDDFSPIKNGGDWHRKRNSNMFDLVTWAVGSNGELSGVINRYYGSVSSVSENSISKVGKSEPQIERVKIADLLK